MSSAIVRKSEGNSKISKSFQNLPVIPGFYTHRAVRDRVIAKAIAGKTKTQIAEEEGLSRPTVRKILNHPETSEFIEQVRLRFMSMSKDAVEMLVRKMERDDDVDIATMILVANGILPSEFMLLCFQQKRRRTGHRSRLANTG
jgi:predicted transcriptional regulator